jgi:excinuclease ABC subunit A
MDSIRLEGARENNLKNINLELPRRKLVVVCGVSGSGKSSLVFDTIYRESRRRYLETLPTYILQFMDRLPRPDMDRLEGLSPAVAIEQRNPVVTSRSTVGTITEIYDYLRLCYARAGDTICPGCGCRVNPDTPDSIADRVSRDLNGKEVIVAFIPARSEKISAETLRESLLSLGFIRVLQGEGREELRIDGAQAALRLKPDEPLFVIVDRLIVAETAFNRLAESLATAFAHGEGFVYVFTGDSKEPLAFSDRFHCPACRLYFPDPTPNLFSFNNSYGACPVCRGFGNLLSYDPGLIVPDSGRSLSQGALDPWSKPRYEGRREILAEFCAGRGIDMHIPWSKLPEKDCHVLLYGDSDFEGVFPFLHRLEAKKYKLYIRFFLRSYQSERTCPECRGSRLRKEADNVLLAGKSISNLSAMSIQSLSAFLELLAAGLSTSRLQAIAELIQEIRSRIKFMNEVGLGYLTLSRMTRTLSGGEYQRIMLTRLLGSGLTDTLFVLDEPTIGLHQRDIKRLVATLRRLVDRGNSLVVVEHDHEVIRSADHIVELGPGSGEEGGRIIFSGTYGEFSAADTLTASSLRESALSFVSRKRPAKHFLKLRGARLNNLKDIDVDFGLGLFNCVSGVSGSGKSTLVQGVLRPAVEAAISRKGPAGPEGMFCRAENWEYLDQVIVVSQSPIGRTPRSNPITYIKSFDHIRRLFAGTKDAERLGLAAGDFSFNTPGGRCERCKGAGYERLEMQFMADIFVPCEACEGKRWGPRALKARYQGKTILEVLDMTVNEAISFFSEHTGIGKPLWVLQSVGLGYLRLGQSATTLSGGESQRLKIARQLILGGLVRRGRGKLYLLDEPTTGLHALEVKKLLRVLDRLVEAGNTVIVVEHHPEVIAHADWIVDLGPEGGDSGGEVVFQGLPDSLASCERSHTGRVLAGLRDRIYTGVLKEED